MKADPFVQLRLLELQALDSTLSRLAHKRRTLPELAEIARVDEVLEVLREKVVLAETEVGDLTRDTAKCEADVEAVRARRHRDEERLASGAITQPKQLQDLEHEVASLQRRQADLEEVELEVMERLETAQGVLDELRATREGHRSDREALVARRDEALAEIDREEAEAAAARDALAPTFPADLLALYDKIRTAEGGVGAGEIARGRCGGCRLDLMGNELAAVRAAAVDDVLRHEECGRIMVRTAESGL